LPAEFRRSRIKILRVTAKKIHRASQPRIIQETFDIESTKGLLFLSFDAFQRRSIPMPCHAAARRAAGSFVVVAFFRQEEEKNLIRLEAEEEEEESEASVCMAL
jgi:hypothetical protein